MGVIQRIKNQIKPGPVRFSASFGSKEGYVGASWKPPIFNRVGLRKTVYGRNR